MKKTHHHGRQSRCWTGLAIGALTGIGVLLSTGATAQEVTYTRDVAPILQENCQECHRPNTAAPMSLLTYDEVRPWAPMIKQRVVEREMPPWPLDLTVGIQEFKNDRSLSDEEIATIAAWVDQGTPMGELADLPPALEFPDYENTWQYAERFGGPPDIVLESPPYTVAANGLDQWPTPISSVEGLETERWIKAIEIRPANPGTRYTFHHGNPSLLQDGERTGLVNSAVGKRGEIFPDDAGKLIKPGAQVNWGMHFFPIGEEVEAVMQLGLWFYPEGERPKYETPGQVQHRTDRSTGMAGYPGHDRDTARRGDLLIPPHGKAMYQGTYVLDKPTRIQDMRGHMHLRGMYQTVEAIYPDGRRELINKLDWDHGWHTTFVYEDHARPLLPKGTVLITTSVFDNTAENHHNPDPDQWVVAGSRSVDEMAHIWIGMTYIPEEDFELMVQEREQILRRMAEAEEDGG